MSDAISLASFDVYGVAPVLVTFYHASFHRLTTRHFAVRPESDFRFLVEFLSHTASNSLPLFAVLTDFSRFVHQGARSSAGFLTVCFLLREAQSVVVKMNWISLGEPKFKSSGAFP